MVWMAGHLRLISMASTAKRITWIVAPAAYQKGPDTPYLKATLDDCSSVAAHVHLDTTSAAVRPALMVRPAVEKTSELFPVWSSSLRPRFENHTIKEVKRAKRRPRTRQMVQPTYAYFRSMTMIVSQWMIIILLICATLYVKSPTLVELVVLVATLCACIQAGERIRGNR